MKTNINIQHLHESVRALCSQGFYLFPLTPGKKTPATTNGFKDAVSDPDEAVRLFNNPHHNIGIATGLSNLVVLDVDGEEGRTSLEKLLGGRSIPKTFTVSARRGNHYYFLQPENQRISCSAGLIGKGLDIRGDGGYVVGPTSWVDADAKGPAATYKIIDDSAVASTPAWLLNAINQTAPIKKRASRTNAVRVTRLADTLENREVLNVLLSMTSADCAYDKWRNIVWGILSTGWLDAEQVALKWSESSPNRFDEKAFNRLIDSYEDGRFAGCIIQILGRHLRGAA